MSGRISVILRVSETILCSLGAAGAGAVLAQARSGEPTGRYILPYAVRFSKEIPVKRAGSDDSLRCSFCHKSQDVVGKLISSPSDYPRAYICDECIARLQFDS